MNGGSIQPINPIAMDNALVSPTNVFNGGIELVSDILPASDGTVGVIEPKSLELGHGSGVYAPSRDIVVTTPRARISIAKDSLVMVVSGPQGTSVYDLHDSKREAVRVTFGKEQISLTPGRHATICAKAAPAYSSVNPVETILHRGVNPIATATGATVFTSEFAIHSAIQSASPLQAMFKSSHPECSRLANKLMKTSAILMHLSTTPEPFQHHLAPRLTASR